MHLEKNKNGTNLTSFDYPNTEERIEISPYFSTKIYRKKFQKHTKLKHVIVGGHFFTSNKRLEK